MLLKNKSTRLKQTYIYSILAELLGKQSYITFAEVHSNKVHGLTFNHQCKVLEQIQMSFKCS